MYTVYIRIFMFTLFPLGPKSPWSPSGPLLPLKDSKAVRAKIKTQICSKDRLQ